MGVYQRRTLQVGDANFTSPLSEKLGSNLYIDWAACFFGSLAGVDTTEIMRSANATY